MYLKNTSKGFTLVELAIVITIIGLLIGGVLKGQEMIVQGRVKATIAQLQQYKAAIITFQDTYNAYPGDLRNASTRLPGCTIACETNISGWGRNGDGFIGIFDWFGGTQVSSGQTQGNAIGPDVGYEALNFWQHLLRAGLTGGVTDEGMRNVIPLAFDKTTPSAPIGGGYMVGSAEGTATYSNSPPFGSVPMTKGTVFFALANSANASIQNAYEPYTNIISPLHAEMIDQKLDDGKPGTGAVRAGGGATAAGSTGCYVTGQDAYNTNASGIRNCKLFIAILSIN